MEEKKKGTKEPDKKKPETKKLPKPPVNQDSTAESIMEFLKNPLVTAVAGYFAGRWHASTQFDKEIEELKTQVASLAEREDTLEGVERKSLPSKKSKNSGVLMLD
jgi:hypothetical protein